MSTSDADTNGGDANVEAVDDDDRDHTHMTSALCCVPKIRQKEQNKLISVQSNPLNGSSDMGSIRLLVQALAGPI